MNIRLKSRKFMMLEVIVAMALATFLSSALLVSYYKIMKAQKEALENVKNVFLADNIYFASLKSFIESDAYYQKELLKEGATMMFEDVDAIWTIAGYDPMKKRNYYLATITLVKGENRLKSYSLILKS